MNSGREDVQRTDSAYAGAVDHVLHRAHLVPPDQLPGLIAAGARLLGATEAVMYLVDHAQEVLTPLPVDEAGPRSALSVDGSLAGRAFRLITPQESEAGSSRRVWIPLLDGVERLGVVELVVPTNGEDVAPDLLNAFTQLCHLAAELLVSKQLYTDFYEWYRRQEGMALQAEMQHALMPPLTFGTDRLVISGMLAPTYEVGGDAFDYALNGNIAHLAVFDAIGHGLQASLLANLAVSCVRNSRRAGMELPFAALEVDRVLADMFKGERFVTALLGQLDIDTGELRWVNCGHPSPMLLRGAQVVKELEASPAMPLGLNGLLHPPTQQDFPVAVEALEPGDRLLLVTDGVDEARTEDGEFFGRERLAEFAAREAASGLPTPEVLRRLQQAILRHQTGQLQDDATTLLVEWLTGKPERMAL
jgi:serine phosphatase RsbU (regulator of sigma subunit)